MRKDPAGGRGTQGAEKEIQGHLQARESNSTSTNSQKEGCTETFTFSVSNNQAKQLSLKGGREGIQEQNIPILLIPRCFVQGQATLEQSKTGTKFEIQFWNQIRF